MSRAPALILRQGDRERLRNWPGCRVCRRGWRSGPGWCCWPPMACRTLRSPGRWGCRGRRRSAGGTVTTRAGSPRWPMSRAPGGRRRSARPMWWWRRWSMTGGHRPGWGSRVGGAGLAEMENPAALHRDVQVQHRPGAGSQDPRRRGPVSGAARTQRVKSTTGSSRCHLIHHDHGRDPVGGQPTGPRPLSNPCTLALSLPRSP